MTVTSMAAAPTSIHGLCNALRRTLSPGLNDELVFLASDYHVGDDQITVRATPRRVGPGTLLSWKDTTLYVTEAATSATLQVMGGYDGAPGVDLPAGTPLRANPRFTDYALFEQVAAVIGSLSSPGVGLFGVFVQEYDGTANDDFYPIPDIAVDEVVRVLRVTANMDGHNDLVRSVRYTVNMSGEQPYLRIYDEADSYLVAFATRITKPTGFEDDAVSDCGLSDSMLDLPVLGAAAYLMQGQEARRVNQRAQGDPRRAEDVPITGAISSARELYRMYRDRLDEEYGRLVRRYPYAATVM